MSGLENEKIQNANKNMKLEISYRLKRKSLLINNDNIGIFFILQFFKFITLKDFIFLKYISAKCCRI